MRKRQDQRGFTLIEVVIVILILGILAGIATSRLGTNVETARLEHTKKELNQLEHAILGNPDLASDGARTDFGYVGDNGALPLSLDALVQNPGGWATWNGPYIEAGLDGTEFKTDAWNTAYVYSDTLIRSTGSGSIIDKALAFSAADLLQNSVTGYVVDADNETPGSSYTDSVVIELVYPDGTGSLATAMATPTQSGSFAFSNLPVGNHTLRVVYIPDSDTMVCPVCVTPRSDVRIRVGFPADLW